ncbi:hypothetical protein AAC387_Pa01g0902 [Persea americana]
MGAEAKPKLTPSLSRASPSFRLRSPSLNALRLRRIFDVFDNNGDGVITLNEISRALERLGLEADRKELESTVLCYIKPGKSGLDFDDFESLHRSLGDNFFGAGDVCADSEQDNEDLMEAFKVFDEDGDGFISAGELQAVLSKLGLPEGREIDRVRQMILSVDRNRDGRVDFEEFKDMMKNVTFQGA